MNLLAIDTSTARASVALIYNGVCYTAQHHEMREHAQQLLPMIDKLFEQAACAIDQLDGIVFGCGPGSFTGLRVACSVAKGLACSHDLPLFPVSGLQAIACDAFEKNHSVDQVLVAIDARMDQMYWDCYERSGQHLGAQVTAASDVLPSLNMPVMIAGVGFEGYRSSFPDELQAQLVAAYERYPDAQAMIRLVQQGHIASITAADAQPIYVRDHVTHGERNG